MTSVLPRPEIATDQSIGRIVSVTGAKCIVLLDGPKAGADRLSVLVESSRAVPDGMTQ